MIQKKFLSSQSLESFINSQMSALLMFSTPICTACNKQELVIDRLLEKNSNMFRAYKINIDAKGGVLNHIARKYKARSFPFMITIKQGKVDRTFGGMLENSNLKDFIDSLGDNNE